MDYSVHDYSTVRPMTDSTFNRFRAFIQEDLGIKMPDAKRTMLQARLQKRMRRLGIASYDDYRDYVFSIHGKEEEMQNMIDAVTTNKTDFFREPKHFQYMVKKALPELIGSHPTGTLKNTNIWSAGCSTGEEPYTLAMILSDFAQQCSGFRFSILATDLSVKVLNKAKMGVYSSEDVEPVPVQMKKNYLLRSKNRSKNLVRIVPELRARIRFGQLNFMSDTFGIRDTMDMIFCRNVLIYFNRSDQERIVGKLCRHLRPGGYLFIGHSETLSGMNLPLRSELATIYRKIP